MFSEVDQEVELYTSSRERQQYDEQANLYAIITATEHLERAYAKDDITREEVSVAGVGKCDVKTDIEHPNSGLALQNYSSSSTPLNAISLSRSFASRRRQPYKA
jgi:hypothetical protein